MPAGVLRRIPQQDRGQRRIERILEAAAEVISEVGVDAATTNAIAARAETSVGSLYQFFPNKDAIVRALASRYRAAMQAAMEQAMPAERRQLPLAEMVERVVTPLARFHERHPAYRHIYAVAVGAGATPGGEEALQSATLERIVGIIAVGSPRLSAEDRLLAAHVCQEMVHSVLNLAATMPPAMRPGLVREAKRALLRYAEAIESGVVTRDGAVDRTGD